MNLLEGVRTMLGSAARELTTSERRRGLRAKKGGEPTVDLVTALGAQYDVQLPGIDPVQIQRRALLVKRLQPLETKLRVIAGLVGDTVSSARTDTWHGTGALYVALTRAARRNVALEREIEPAVEFFKKARGAKAKVGSADEKGSISSTPRTP